MVFKWVSAVFIYIDRIIYQACSGITVPAWLEENGNHKCESHCHATLPRRFSVQFDFILFTIDGFTFTPLFAHRWSGIKRHGAVLQVQGGTVSHRHDHINH